MGRFRIVLGVSGPYEVLIAFAPCVWAVGAWPRRDDVLRSGEMRTVLLLSIVGLLFGAATGQDDAKSQTRLGTDYLLGRGV